MVITCSASSTGCSNATAAAAEAGKALGWKVEVTDGKYDPTVVTSLIENAIAQDFDGIILTSTTPGSIQPALRAARDAGIPVLNAIDIPAGDPLTAGDEPLQWKRTGELLGRWLIEDSGGDARVVVVRGDDFPGVKVRADALVSVLEGCEGCEVIEEPSITGADALSPRMETLVSSLLASHGDELEYLVLPYGASWSFAEPAIRAASRDDLRVATYEGDPPEIQGCQDGLVQAIGALHIEWLGWAMIDQMNRILSDDPVLEESGVPVYLIDESNCGDVSTADDLVEFDFKSEYLRLWGVEG